MSFSNTLTKEDLSSLSSLTLHQHFPDNLPTTARFLWCQFEGLRLCRSRIVVEGTNIKTSFVCAKSTVASIKTLTFPRKKLDQIRKLFYIGITGLVQDGKLLFHIGFLSFKIILLILPLEALYLQSSWSIHCHSQVLYFCKS